MSKFFNKNSLSIIILLVSILCFYSCERLIGPDEDKSGSSTTTLMQSVVLPPGYDAIVFDGMDAGTVVDEVYSYNSAGPVMVWGTNPGPYVTESNGTITPTVNAAIIFDSSNPTGLDLDLGSPNESFGGPGVGDGGTDPGSLNNLHLMKS